MVLTRIAALAAAALALGSGGAHAQQPAPAPSPRAAGTTRPAAPASSASRAATPAAPAAEAGDGATFAALADAYGDRQQQRRTAWLGVGLSCSRCSFHTEGKSLSRWVFNEPPVLYQVDPGGPADRAGLRSGDTLVAINGLPLTSAGGGQAFANLVPGVSVRLAYRRGGRDRTTSVRPEPAPAQRELAELRDAARAQQQAQTEAAREMARDYQRDTYRAQRELQRAQEELARNRGKLLSEESRRLIRESIDQARRSLGATPSPWFAVPSPRAPTTLVPPSAAPVPEAGAVAPPAIAAAPAPAPIPAPRSLGWAVWPPGGLRYSGRLGSTLIEARRPGGVDVIETGDSEVVLTGGDLSVRIALEPGRTARVRPVTAAGWSAARSSAGDAIWGIQGYLVNPRLGRALGAASGVLVLDVAGNSNADSLGIRPGDVVVSLNDHPVVAVTPGTLLEFRGLRLVPNRPAVHSLVVVRSGVRRSLAPPRTARPRDAAPQPPPRRNR